MPRRRSQPDQALGRSNEPGVLILTSLASGPMHGYALAKDIEEFAGVTLGPGTLYGAITRLEERGLIEATAGDSRRRPYGSRPTAAPRWLRWCGTCAPSPTRGRPGSASGCWPGT